LVRISSIRAGRDVQARQLHIGAGRRRCLSAARAHGRRRALRRRLAAAELEDQRRRQLQPGTTEAGSTAAGEAVLGVGVDAGGAAGLGRADRIEPGALDEHVGGRLGTARGLAAHDAADADGAAEASAMTQMSGVTV
jgi:hypothetical protein